VAEHAPSVEVAYALPERQRVVRLALPPTGLTAGQAFELAGLQQEFPELLGQAPVLGIYGVPCGPDRPLRDGDRVEIYRPLRTDPRVRRREQVAATPRKGWKRPR
jgi:putative ubiquitin-RnfH superfamily antitoxin RatB of RatAB toxin-antitoxin module